MPELNYVYGELFSNKGATFYSRESPMTSDEDFIPSYLKNHANAIPLTHMKTKNGKSYAYFAADEDESIDSVSDVPSYNYSVKLNRDYWIEQKKVIILGHNSRCKDIMDGFFNFRNEWNKGDGSEILQIIVIDDEDSLESVNYYRDYPFVVKTVTANIYDKDIICSSIEEVISANDGDTGILILSDDKVPGNDIDANALANLIYVQDIINGKISDSGNFDKEKIDVIVEIIDPKHHDVVSSYSVNNVVISNRYISKMITQIAEKDALFEFYKDMLAYDDVLHGYESKEIYTRKVSGIFKETPKPCTAAELIRAVYLESVSEELPIEKRYPTVTLGYVKADGRVTFFAENQIDINVSLMPEDKLIVYSVH